MNQYSMLKLTIEERLQRGQKEGRSLMFLDDLPDLLKSLPDETQRKQMLRETVLTTYWGREKALSFDDKDVYIALMMVKISHEQYKSEKPTQTKGLWKRICDWYGQR